MILLWIALILIILVLTWHFLTKKYINPYKLYILFGPKGVGKSTKIKKLVHLQKY